MNKLQIRKFSEWRKIAGRHTISEEAIDSPSKNSCGPTLPPRLVISFPLRFTGVKWSTNVHVPMVVLKLLCDLHFPRRLPSFLNNPAHQQGNHRGEYQQRPQVKAKPAAVRIRTGVHHDIIPSAQG